MLGQLPAGIITCHFSSTKRGGRRTVRTEVVNIWDHAKLVGTYIYALYSEHKSEAMQSLIFLYDAEKVELNLLFSKIISFQSFTDLKTNLPQDIN